MTAHGGIPGITMGHGNPAATGESERCTECGIRFGYHSAACSALTDLRAAVEALATPAAAAEPAWMHAELTRYLLSLTAWMKRKSDIPAMNVWQQLNHWRNRLATPAAAAEADIMKLVDEYGNAEHHQNDGQALYWRGQIEAAIALRTAGSKP